MQQPTLLQPSTSGSGEPSSEPKEKGSSGKELTPGQLEYKRNIELMPDLALYGGDPNCDHEEVSSPGGGVKCKYCSAWFCF